MKTLVSAWLFVSLLFSFNVNNAFAESRTPRLFLFFGPNEKLDIRAYKEALLNPCVAGAQIVYTWKELEPEKDKYNFSRIEKDKLFLASIHKKLFIQLQDRSFQKNLIYVPAYIRKEKIYHGGVAMQFDFPGESKPISEGWVARVWDPSVRKRFQQLMKKLALQFDGSIYGINLPETAIDLDPKKLPQGFTPDAYFYGELDNISALRKAFHKSIVIQYVNFFPGEWNNNKNYMGSLFLYAIKNHIGLGGPDVVPYRKGQMKNSYPFFHQYKNNLVAIGMAVQPPDYTYKKVGAGTDDYYTFSDFYQFATQYLGATIIFWNTQEPFYSKMLVPHINKDYFFCDFEKKPKN